MNEQPENPLVGHTLGGLYRLEEILALGANAIVYRGAHVRLGHSVVVKVLAGTLVSPASRARFEAEARVQAQLDHPNIVRIHDFLAEEDLYAIVMEWVDGTGLDHVLHELQAPMTPSRLKNLALPILDAVEHAHQRGVIHRDLKPSNILVTTVSGREFPKVVDFGIAKMLAEEVSLTAPGAMLGTLLYMSPEQCKALKSVDERADIYSLGITLYQMATGMVPFYADSAFDIVLAHIQMPPTPPSELNPNLHPQLERIILRAIEKNPEDRFQSANEMADALRAVREGASGEHRGLTGPIRTQIPGITIQRDVVDPAVARSSKAAPARSASLPESRDSTPWFDGESPLQSAVHEHLLKQHGGPDYAPSLPSSPASGPRAAPEAGSEAGLDDLEAAILSDEAASNAPKAGPGSLRLLLRVPSKDDWFRFFDSSSVGGGIFCPVSEPPRVGTTLRLEVTFIRGPRFVISGMVTWRRVGQHDARARNGVGIHVHPADRGKLAYINAWARGGVDNKRRLRRLPLRLRVAYSVRRGRRVNFTRDLNESGVFIWCSELLDLGHPVRLLLLPPRARTPIKLKGVVTRQVHEADQRGMGISLEFDNEAARLGYIGLVKQLEGQLLAGKLPEDALS